MRKFIYALMISGVVILAGCSLPQMVKLSQDQELTVVPNPLEVHADTVNFEMSAVLPVKMLKKGKVYQLNSFYVYGNDELALETIEFKEEDYPNAKTEEAREKRSFSFAYNPAMKSGNLEVQGVALNPKNGNNKTTERLPVAPGVITTSKMVQPVYYSAYADHGYNNQEELVPTNINFFFDRGRSELKYSERTSDRGKFFEAFIAEKNVTRTVTITGMHSPEGTETINTKLSENRAKVIEDFYRRNMRKYDYKGLSDSINFILKPINLDWAAFKKELEAYEGITSEQKSEYLNIINGSGDFVSKEKDLRKLSTYNKVFRDVYPKLRTAKTEVLTVMEKKTDAEISVLAKQISSDQADADTLSHEELLYAATLTPSLSEKAAIYGAAVKKHDDWVSHNNLAAVHLAMAAEDEGSANSHMEKANTHLETSAKKKESAEAHINMASSSLMAGNAAKAYDHLKMASSLNPSNDAQKGMNGVKAALEIMMAKYGDAVRSGSAAEQTADNLFNKGLAQLLNKEYQNAANTFGEVTEMDGDYAAAYYAAAIANARQNKLDGVVSNLSKAGAADPDLKSLALEDLEFVKMLDNPAFREALK